MCVGRGGVGGGGWGGGEVGVDVDMHSAIYFPVSSRLRLVTDTIALYSWLPV